MSCTCLYLLVAILRSTTVKMSTPSDMLMACIQNGFNMQCSCICGWHPERAQHHAFSILAVSVRGVGVNGFREDSRVIAPQPGQKQHRWAIYAFFLDWYHSRSKGTAPCLTYCRMVELCTHYLATLHRLELLTSQENQPGMTLARCLARNTC